MEQPPPPPPPPRPPPPAVDKKLFHSFLDSYINGHDRSFRTDLLRAILDGGHLEIRGILDALTDRDRADLLHFTVQGLGPLQIASHFENVDICRLLIDELNFDVNERCRAGPTPLGCASLFGEADMVNFLLRRGADPNKKDRDGYTPLQNAAQNGSQEVIHLLLANGAELDTIGAQGTAVHIAASYGNMAALKILLDHDSNPNWSSEEIHNPLATTIASTRYQLQESALECVKLLVKAGANVNSTKPDTPLVMAIVCRFMSCVQYLLNSGADANVPDKELGCLPIQLAARDGNRELVDILLPYTSPIRAVTSWTSEGIISHEKLSRSKSKMHKRSASNSLNVTPRHKKHRTSPTNRSTTPRRSSASVTISRGSYSAQSKFEKRKTVTRPSRRCKRILQYGVSSESSDGNSTSDRLGIITLGAYAARYRKRLAESIRVPHMNATRKLTRRGPKLVLRRIHMSTERRHIEKMAMNGGFTADDFTIDMVDNSVTIHNVAEVPFTSITGGNDWHQFVVMVRKEVFADKGIPDDVQYWLGLISQEEDPWSPDLLSNHIYMLDSRQAYGMFMSFVSTIHRLRRDKPSKYYALYNSEIFDKYHNWNYTFRFEKLNETVDYKDPETRDAYDRDVMGLMWVFRCCWQHRAQHFPHFLVAVVLGDKVPDLLSDVQKALFGLGIRLLE